MSLPEPEMTTPGIRADADGLAPMLQLDTLGADHYRARRIAQNMAGHIFGGQLLGSAMAAAIASRPGHHPHLLQAFFLRAGRADAAVDIDVERSKDGRRFAHRRVALRQADKLLLSAEVSFHDDEDGPEHQDAVAPQVPPPETLADIVELADRHRDQLPVQTYQRMLMRPSLQIRPCDPDSGFIRPTLEPRLVMWIKPAGDLSPAAAYAALAFMSDNWLVGPCTSPHTRSFFDGEWAASSLNHALWIHRRPDLSDWLLFEVESPIVRGRRGLGRGFIYQRDGALLATAMQECLLQAV